VECVAKLKKLKGLNIAFELLEQINLDRLKTLYSTLDNVEALIIFKDKRKLSSKQRRLYRALLNDIYNWSGQDTEFLHEWFKEDYFFKTGKRISTADHSSNSKEDMNQLLELVIDFMFAWNVPFKKGYELLPKEEQWFLYQCIKHRKCCVTGKPADIHHATNLVGMGRNRNKINNLDSSFIALSREKHTEIHQIGLEAFCKKYYVKPIKIDKEAAMRLNLNVEEG